MTRKAICHLKSKFHSPYSPSKWYELPKMQKETADDYERQTWMNRAHFYKEDGMCYIPAMQFCNCLKAAAKFRSAELQVAGEGKARYTKNIEAGVMVFDNLDLGVNVNDLESERILVPADGKRGGTTRVPKTFPVFPTWEGDVEFYVFDDKIPEEKFEYVLRTAGNLIGIGISYAKAKGIILRGIDRKSEKRF